MKLDDIIFNLPSLNLGNKQSLKDEKYVIDLCDEVLKCESSRQHKFDFLKGDSGRKLPVDAYYSKLSLVVEHRERQHTEGVAHFDKPNVMTVSGVHRGEQRLLYDQRRRDILPQNGIALIEINYSDFRFNHQKRIERNYDNDINVVRRILSKYL
ncbi:MAG: hypothetical protein RSC11_03620 [Mucinivorans sp.]